MQLDLALVDLVRPYLLKGESTPWHAALSILFVESCEAASSADGTVIRGIARFSGAVEPPSFDPVTGTLRAGAGNVEGHPRRQPDRSEPWLDITDARVEFALTVPRAAGQIVAGGVASVPGGTAAFQPVRDVLDALDAIPGDAPPSDYPGTGFTLDLVLAGIEFRPPFLKPARMEANGLLVPDDTRSDVVFHLPKVKLRVSQGSDAGAVLDVALVSLGVAGLDDPGDLAAAELVTMEPAYAFIGGGRVVGFAFRSAVLDLADGYTPPEVLDQFGFDESWTGLYLPEIRLFFAPNGAEDFAVNAGVENLLIGLGASSGITGDFDVAVIDQGAGELALSARFFDGAGRAIGIRKLTDTAAEAWLPATTRMVADVTGGRAPYTVTATIGGADRAGNLHTVTATARPEPVAISVRDASAPPKTRDLVITVRLREAQASEPPPGGQPDQPATLETTAITLDGAPQAAPPLRLVSDLGRAVVVSVDGSSDPGTQWQVDGAPAGTAATLTLDLAGGETRAVRAALSGQTVTAIDGYFRFDHPPIGNVATFSVDPLNTSADEATDPAATAPWKPPARQFLPAWRTVLSRVAPRTLTIEGRASFDGDPEKAKYNYLLSQRRAEGLEALIASDPVLAGFTVNAQPPDVAAAQTPPGPWTAGWLTHGAPRAAWWKAEIRDFSVTLPGPVIDGEARRPAAPDPPPPVPEPRDPPPANPDPPSWFRQARLKVRIVQDQFVAVELSGQVDFQTALEDQIDSSGGVTIPDIQGLGANPADGITDFLLLYQTDPASQTDAIRLYLGADPEDRDGLVKTGQLQGQALEAPSTGRNILGMTTIFTPLLATIAPPNPADGGIAPLALSAAVVGLPVALAEITVDGERLLNIERVVLFGGEANFRRVGPRWETTILFDVETALSAKIRLGGFTLLEIPRDTPLAVRYKAIGLRFGQPPGSTAGWELRPVFDQSKGYTIDVSGPGQIRLPDPLGKVLQVLGARIARTNPLAFEIDLGFAVDLGVVTVERARVRLPLDPLGPPELTAFAAGLNVPGVLEGRGYMEMNNSGGSMEIKGGIDVSLVPIRLRIAAQVAVAQISAAEGGPATGVAIALEVELPVAIPLAQSGFGIYGFLGLFAMHYARDETGITSLTPALTWLRDRAQGDPTNLQAWRPEVDRWAFGAGIVLGTMGSPIIFNVKGMFLLELPGPRILLVVKANLLAVVPALKDKTAEGTFLCVIDLDFGRRTLTIGMSVDFSIDPIVEIRIPVEAFFNLKSGGDWHVYLGTFPGVDAQGRQMPGPIRIMVLQVFDGAGYVMISGHGIPQYQPTWTSLPALPAVQGTALAVGLEVSLVWGNVPARLYLRVTAGFNAVLGFEPLYVGGLLYLRGELKLFIVSLSASAGLSVQVGEKIVLLGGVEVREQLSRIDGEVCGELDLWFFTLKGCVDFHIGEDKKILPPAPRLVAAATLVGRSPALAQGTGTDRKIDAKIADAVAGAAAPAAAALPVVPIDAIPVLVMASTPRDDTLKIFGADPLGSPGAPADGFVRAGDFAYRFDLKEVRLETEDGSPALTGGAAPSVWWTLNPPADGNLTAQLALLDWTPNPTPKALERSEFLEQSVIERWGSVCTDAAPAAAVLWTFNRERLGPSPTGWRVDGVAWPDPPGTVRSQEAEAELRVSETWRSGDHALDRRRGIVPAAVEGSAVRCLPKRAPEPPDGPVRPAGGFADLVLRMRDPVRPALALDPPAARPADALPADALPADAMPAGPTGLGTGARPRRFRERLADEQARLAGATAGSFAMRRTERLDVPFRTLDGIVSDLGQGQPVFRAALFAAAGARQSAANPDGPDCDGRVLAAPLWDIGRPVVFGDRSAADEIAAALDAAGRKHGPLADVIDLATGPIRDGHVLLYVNERLLNKDTGRGRLLHLHYLDAEGAVLGERPVRFSDLLPGATLPPRWIDPAGPWLEDVFHAALHAGTIASRTPALVALEPPEGTVGVRIGVLYPPDGDDLVTLLEQQGRPYYVAAIELTRQSEATRHDWDQTQIDRDRKVVEAFLGPASADVALLQPGRTYRITTVTGVTVRDPEGDEQPGDDQTATFWFRTDAAAPARLEPWLLCTLPDEKEGHVFGHEPIKVVFNTNDVDKLYGSYGKELRARLKAASFRQVDVPGVAHPFPLSATTLMGVRATHLAPFEAVLSDVLAATGPCIPVDGERVRHTVVEIPIPMDPHTDYLLDIEAVDIGAPATATGPRVLRRAFSTGGFASTEDFATRFAATSTEHRAVAPGALAAVAAGFAARQPEGPEFDAALIAAGLEPMPVPEAPRVLIFWEQAGPAATPAPAAVMIDASEPMRRLRHLPLEVASADPVPVRRLKLVAQEWLTLGEAPGGAALVDRTVYAPGAQRVLLTLKPGARGRVLHLDLVRRAFPLAYLDGPAATDARFRIVSETLIRAPWEEED